MIKAPLPHTRLAGWTAAAALLLSAASAQAQAVIPPDLPRPANITNPAAVARIVPMPSVAQLDVINAYNNIDQAQEQAVAVARAALVEASLGETANANLIRQRAQELADAEIALATVRANELARIQSSANRLTRAQIDQLILPAATGAAAAGGGRGGGGRGAVGSGEYPADPNSVIQMLPGFRTEIVARAYRPIQGSWISITEDPQGRLILGANEQQPFTRLTLGANGQVTRNETIYTPISEAMGTEWIDDSLYVQGGRAVGDAFVYGKPNPTFCCESGLMGLHKLRDSDGDGNFESLETLRAMNGTEAGHSDHGVHDIVPSPDGRYIYQLNGDMVYLPEQVSPNSPVRFNADDRVIPVLTGGGRGGAPAAPAATAPAPATFTPPAMNPRHGLGGTLSRTDKNGQNFELIATGLRNPLHFKFNADGEVFLYDSDHEPEVGVPWYTPTRVNFVPSGANFGHRPGGSSGKYPSWYEDRLPTLFEMGLGSPVGVTFGYNTKFPAAYQKALYVADNNYGRIIALHLKPLGSGYTVTNMEYFAHAKSLFGNGPATTFNVTDMMVAKDGTFYFLIGSRSAQSYLMKATYVGNQPTAKVDYVNVDGAADRALRRSLEAFHTTTNHPQAVAAAWPHLGSEDRYLRYAARVALETVSPATWKQRALAETDVATSIIAMLALARTAGPTANEEIFATLAKYPLASLPDRLKIQKLRVIQVAISRNGKPSSEALNQVVADVDAIFPGTTFEINTEASQILASLNAPSAVPKTMRLAQLSRIYQENFAYRYNLRNTTVGWTPELRRSYFEWFNVDHANDAFYYNYREWFARVNRLPALAGNAGPMGQVKTAAQATLTEAERNDAALTAIINTAAPAAGAGGGRGGGAAIFGP